MSEAPLTATEICQLLDDLALCPDLRGRLEALLATTVEHEHHRAYELIGAAEIKMSTIVDNHGQARELAKVPEEKRVEVLQTAVESAEREAIIAYQGISFRATVGKALSVALCFCPTIIFQREM